ncbi:hypothetical protein AX768_07020 [Burkholderia sp. PAMC 28687]|uniref:hypothetical protein n=1 Tax=Burkholderia sp. PAMC 28687 TaxID=1795874 RepID=UPI0007803FD0|nr:hypothetical protein [Burkholderia sp. PAMC 28687]AMM13889.1 hypothetical protein AX768_07020 [Burkholderia sp. PAMC 28687]
MINPIINAAILKRLNTTQSLQFAISKDWNLEQTRAVFGDTGVTGRVKALIERNQLTVDGVPVEDYLDTVLLNKAIEQGNSGKPGLMHFPIHSSDPVRGMRAALGKAVVAPATTGNTGALYYPSQAPGVLLPPVTPALITALANGGAAVLPPNTRLLTQAALLSASEIAEGAPYPAAAPSLAFTLTNTDRKFGLILAYSREMVAASNFDSRVQDYVQGQLEAAANNATDAFLIALMTSGGTAAASVGTAGINAAMATFAGDLRSAVWIANPATLVSLQDAANPNIGASGGVYKGAQALASLAAPAGKLFLVDRARLAVFDGPQIIESTDEASIVMDSAPGAAVEGPTHLFQSELVALKVTKFADARLLSAPLVINLS